MRSGILFKLHTHLINFSNVRVRVRVRCLRLGDIIGAYVTEGARRLCFHPCLIFVKIEYFSSILVDYSVCLFICMSTASRSQFQTDFHETSPNGRVRQKQESICFWGQNIKKSTLANIGQISKIVKSHLIDLKFEEDLPIWSLNSNTYYIWGLKVKRST